MKEVKVMKESVSVNGDDDVFTSGTKGKGLQGNGQAGHHGPSGIPRAHCRRGAQTIDFRLSSTQTHTRSVFAVKGI